MSVGVHSYCTLILYNIDLTVIQRWLLLVAVVTLYIIDLVTYSLKVAVFGNGS